MIEGIVFDLWNTLGRNVQAPDPMGLLAEALGIREDPHWVRRLERGMMLAPAGGMEGALRQIEFREGLTIADPGRRRQVVERWSRAGKDAALFPDVLSTLRLLGRRYRLGILSNTQSFGLEFLEREGLWKYLDASALSFEVGALKPRREIYLSLAHRIGLATDKLLMVGDHPVDDVAGARDAGMHAVLLQRNGADHGPHGAALTDAPVIKDLADLPERVFEISERA